MEGRCPQEGQVRGRSGGLAHPRRKKEKKANRGVPPKKSVLAPAPLHSDQKGKPDARLGSREGGLAGEREKKISLEEKDLKVCEKSPRRKRPTEQRGFPRPAMTAIKGDRLFPGGPLPGKRGKEGWLFLSKKRLKREKKSLLRQ